MCEDGFVQIHIVFFNHAHGEWKELKKNIYYFKKLSLLSCNVNRNLILVENLKAISIQGSKNVEHRCCVIELSSLAGLVIWPEKILFN